MNRRAGRIRLTINGVQFDAKGSFTYSPGGEQREAIVGADAIHGYAGTERVPFIEGIVTDRGDLSLEQLFGFDGETAVLELANGKGIVLQNAWYAGDGQVTTEQGEINVRFEARSGSELAA